MARTMDTILGPKFPGYGTKLLTKAKLIRLLSAFMSVRVERGQGGPG